MARRSSRLPLHLPFFEDIHTARSLVRLEPENDGSYTVYIDGMESSHIHPDPTHLMFEYMRWMAGIIRGTYNSDDPLAIGHLGGGAAALPRALAHMFPRSTNSVVEVDRELNALVREWVTDLPRAPRVALRAADAFDALEQWRDDRFDILIRDTFVNSVTPAHMRSLEAATHVARVLKPHGMFLANAAIAPNQQELANEIVTLREVFGRIDVITEPSAVKKRRRSNAILCAGRELTEEAHRAIRTDAVTVRILDEETVNRIAKYGRVDHVPKVFHVSGR